ncbi:MAG: hypothetical protein WCW47_00100 [Candidatus Paceibacterota bacterium]|jgi:hypothetical protein
MKTLVTLTLLVLLSVNASAQTTTSSWTGFAYGHIEFGSSQDTDLTRMRPRADRTPSKGRCDGGRVELDLVDAGKSYVHQAYLSCNMNGWTVKTGRLFSAALMQSPPPFLLKTAKYPNSWTYAAYAYGLEVERSLGKGWQVLVDFTGQSGLKYSDGSHLFNRFESAGRVKRVTGSWTYGGAYQASRDFFRTGVDAEYRWKKLTANTLLAYTTERRHVEGFLFAEYNLTKWLRPHVQVNRGKGETSTLAGVGAYVKKYVYFVAEYDGHNFYSRLQLMLTKK